MRSFNPRTRESATMKDISELHIRKVSIHALVRVRPRTTHNNKLIESFNPRTRESATYDPADMATFLRVSIHALVRVRLKPQGGLKGVNLVSIHALVRVRQTVSRGVPVPESFQSTHS